jgi:transposase InsO family protein
VAVAFEAFAKEGLRAAFESRESARLAAEAEAGREAAADAERASAEAAGGAELAGMPAWRRDAALARLAVLRLAGAMGDAAFAAAARDGELPEAAAAAVRAANARNGAAKSAGRGGGGEGRARAVSARTLQRWRADCAARGPAGLAPGVREAPEPAWARPLLDAYRRPQKPSRAAAVADGHTFDAEVRHPFNGRPFRPELTVVADAHTRRVVGLSAWLSESALSVMAAFRSCVVNEGVPALYYSDRGPGHVNAQMDAMLARVGTERATGLPRNPQGHGLMERLNRTLWVDLCAKRLATYMGKPMDREARQITYKDTRRNADSKAILSWGEFRGFALAAVAEYNARPHRSLPTVTDESGRRVHLSPDQAWQRAVDAGWRPVTYDRDALDELLPFKEAKVARGEVRVAGNVYSSKDLAEFHGERVRAAYDPWDASRVWVRDAAGRLLAVAGLDANKCDYFPLPEVARDMAKRDAGVVRRAKARLAGRRDVDAWAAGPGWEAPRLPLPYLDVAAAPGPLDCTPEAAPEDKTEIRPASGAADRTPDGGAAPREDAIDRLNRVLEVVAAGGEPPPREAEWARGFAATPKGRRVLRLLSVDPTSLERRVE